MRVITKDGSDIPYEAVSLGIDYYTKCLCNIETTLYVAYASPIYRDDGGKYTLAEYETRKETEETLLQIAILAAKGKKLIRMQDNGAIEVVV